jgi:hypothetical protein
MATKSPVVPSSFSVGVAQMQRWLHGECDRCCARAFGSPIRELLDHGRRPVATVGMIMLKANPPARSFGVATMLCAALLKIWALHE